MKRSVQRHPRRVIVVAIGVAAVTIAVAAPAWTQPAPVDNPLEVSRRATGNYAFSGQVLIRWSDATGEHEQLVDVRSTAGSLMVQGSGAALARHDERLIRQPGSGWNSVWPAGLGSLDLPRPTRKYQLAASQGLLVAGRPTTLVEVRRGVLVVERVWVDAVTGLVLGREQYGNAGAASRSLQFQQISVGTPEGTVPSPRVHSPEVAVTDFRDFPARLPGGYQRLGAYRRGALVHVVYSDGVYGLSVFEQAGRLRTGALPGGADRLGVGKSKGWHYSWAGGHVLLWQGHDRVYSAVGDGPLDDVVGAGAGVPLGPRPSMLERLRGACRSALHAITG